MKTLRYSGHKIAMEINSTPIDILDLQVKWITPTNLIENQNVIPFSYLFSFKGK